MVRPLALRVRELTAQHIDAQFGSPCRQKSKRRKQVGSSIHDVFHYIILTMLSFLTCCSKYVIVPYPTVAETFANAYIFVILCTIEILSTTYKTTLESSVDYAAGSRLYYRPTLQTILYTIRLYYRLYCKLYYRP